MALMTSANLLLIAINFYVWPYVSTSWTPTSCRGSDDSDLNICLFYPSEADASSSMCDKECCYSLQPPARPPPSSSGACTVEQAKCVNNFLCEKQPSICFAGNLFLLPINANYTWTFNTTTKEYCFTYYISLQNLPLIQIEPILFCSHLSKYNCFPFSGEVDISTAIQTTTVSLITSGTSTRSSSRVPPTTGKGTSKNTMHSSSRTDLSLASRYDIATPMGSHGDDFRNIQIGVGVGVGVGGFLLIVALVVLLISCIRKRKRQRESMKSVTVNNDYTTVQIPNATADSAPIYTPLTISSLSDDTSNNIITPRPQQSSNDNNDYEDALAVDTNKAQNLTRGKFGGTANTTYPNAPGSEFTITDNDMYQATPGENAASEVDSSYSLEKLSENGVLAKKTTDVGYEGFIIVENDLYH